MAGSLIWYQNTWKSGQKTKMKTRSITSVEEEPGRWVSKQSGGTQHDRHENEGVLRRLGIGKSNCAINGDSIERRDDGEGQESADDAVAEQVLAAGLLHAGGPKSSKQHAADLHAISARLRHSRRGHLHTSRLPL
jgi:hypothetical protein